MTKQHLRNQDIDTLARTIYGEARGEYKNPKIGLKALTAVGYVVLNRYLEKKWYGSTIEDVCLKPYQFSCWNKSDPNLSIITSVQKGDVIFDVCSHVAESVLFFDLADPTFGANHYFATSMKTPPAWALGRLALTQIGHHKFYKL